MSNGTYVRVLALHIIFILREARSLLGLRPKMYGFIHIPHVLVKCRSCSPYLVAFHRQLTDCQTWISIFKRTQSGYKSADLPDFTYLVQKFASTLYLHPSSRSPLAASLCSWYTSNMDFYSLKTWYHQHSTSFGELHSLDGSNVRPTKMVARCWIVVADTFTNSHR